MHDVVLKVFNPAPCIIIRRAACPTVNRQTLLGVPMVFACSEYTDIKGGQDRRTQSADKNLGIRH